MKDKIKKAIKEEFHYRASQGRTEYSMEELLYIVNEVIDEVFWEKTEIDASSDSDRCESDVMSQDQLRNLDIRMGIIKGDLQCLTEKVNKLSSLLDASYKQPKF